MTNPTTARIPLVLHIGMHKTGSSSLQSFLARNSDKLAAQKVLYPECYRDFLNGHHALAYNLGAGRPEFCAKWKSWRRPPASEMADEMRRKGCRRIILSSEEFFSARDNAVAELKEHFRDFDVSVLIYFRRQDLYLCSLYAERVKTIFDKEDIGALAHRARHPSYNYLGVVDRYARAFGRENVTIRVFEKQQMPNGLYADFMQAVNCEMDETFRSSDPESDNVSFTPEATELIRFFNKNITKKMHHWRVRQVLSGRPEAQGKSPLGQISLPVELQRKVLARTRPDNEEIAQNYLGRPDGKLFYNPLPKETGPDETTSHIDSIIRVLDTAMFKFLLNNGPLGPHITKCIDFFFAHVASTLIDIQEWDLDASDREGVTFDLPHLPLKLDSAYLEIENNSARSATPIVTVMAADGAVAQKWTCYTKTEKGFLFGPKNQSGCTVERIQIDRIKGLSGAKVRLTRLFKRDS